MQSPFRRAAAAPAPMPMLAFPGKRPGAIGEDASAAEKDGDLAALMRYRRRLVDLSLSERGPPHKDGCGEVAGADLLRAYLRELRAVAPRFDAAFKRTMAAAAPQGGDGGSCGGGQLGFTWHDAAGTSSGGRQSLHTSLAAERAVALFSLAAQESRLAAAEDRRGADGVRRACAALCDAAGALSAAASARGGDFASEASGQLCHMSAACMAVLEKLMLVQALECYFELAVAGGKPPALCSKVAQQVSLDYEQVSYSITPEMDKSWPPHVQAKAAYFGAEACFRSAQALRAQDDVGEAIARLRHGLASLDGAKRPLRSAAWPVQDAARWLKKEMETELGGAERENCRIYCMRVPHPAALAELPALPQPLVRPTPVEKILMRGAAADDAAAGERVS